MARRGVYVLVDVFLQKPFALSALLAKVRAVREGPPEPPPALWGLSPAADGRVGASRRRCR